jgi:hypothetical protein
MLNYQRVNVSIRTWAMKSPVLAISIHFVIFVIGKTRVLQSRRDLEGFGPPYFHTNPTVVFWN